MFKKEIVWLCAAATALSLNAEVIIKDSFEGNAVGSNLPAGWQLYKQGPNLGKIEFAENGGGKEVRIADSFKDSEIGLTRRFPAQPGKFYRFGALLRLQDSKNKETPFIQLRFLPSNKLRQIKTTALGSDSYVASLVAMQAPEGTREVQVFLYTFKPVEAAYAVRSLILEESDQDFANTSPWGIEVGKIIDSPLANAKLGNQGQPDNWLLYSKGSAGDEMTITSEGLKMVDNSKTTEVGISRNFATRPGQYFRARVQGKAADGKTAGTSGFVMQVSFFAAKKHQATPVLNTADFKVYEITGQVPADTTSGSVYLYSHKSPTGAVLLKDFSLELSDTPFGK